MKSPLKEAGPECCVGLGAKGGGGSQPSRETNISSSFESSGSGRASAGIGVVFSRARHSALRQRDGLSSRRRSLAGGSIKGPDMEISYRLISKRTTDSFIMNVDAAEIMKRHRTPRRKSSVDFCYSFMARAETRSTPGSPFDAFAISKHVRFSKDGGGWTCTVQVGPPPIK